MFKPNVSGCLPSSGFLFLFFFFNPDDGKQQKTFGLNILIFFNFFTIYKTNIMDISSFVFVLSSEPDC